MEERLKNNYAIFFDKSVVLKISRWAGIIAWVVLVVYLLTSSISFAQFMTQFVTGVFYQKGMSILDLLGFFTPYLMQSIPGAVYFFGLKFVENGLLILMEIEESARRSSRSS